MLDAVDRYLDELGVALEEPPDPPSPDPAGPEISSSLLEPPETTSPNSTDHSYRGRFMAGKEAEYQASLEAYEAIYVYPSNGHIEGMSNCRKFAIFAREKTTGEVKVMSSACNDRWCPMCAASKAAYAKGSTQEYIEAMSEPRFLTLTLRHNVESLSSQLEFLTDSFRRIRQRAYWKRNVTGGIWFLQVKRGSGDGCWHPHLHILIDGNYMEQHRLSELWELVTFGSPVIDIRRIHDPEATASYVARYTARPAKMADMPLPDRIEVIESLKGKRLCGTFGNAKGVKLTPPKIKDGSTWQDIGYYDRVMVQAASDPLARTILFCYNTNRPLSEQQFEQFTGHPVNVVIEPLERPPNLQMFLDFNFKKG